MKYSLLIIGFLFLGNLLAQKLIPFRHGDQWGYLDKSGIVVVNAIYQSADELFHNRGRVQKDGKYGFIDESGQLVIDCVYDVAGSFNKYRYASVVKDGQEYCIDPEEHKTACVKGCRLITRTITSPLHFDIYKKNGKIGLYRKVLDQNEPESGLAIPPTWDKLIENDHGYAAVKIGKQWAIIDNSGEYSTPFLYDTIIINTDGFFLVNQNGKYGLLNKSGDILIQPKYHKLTFFSPNHLAKAWLDEKFWFYIDEQGREYYRKD